MKIGEIIQNITSLEGKGVPSDDTRFSPRHVYSRMLVTRASLLIQKQTRRQRISQASYQTLPCVEMIKAPVHECPCLPPVGCMIYRTKYPIPEPLVGLDTHLLQSVSSADGSTIYSETTFIEKKYKSGNKYTSNVPDYYIMNGHVYITADKMFNDLIPITGLFNDPEKVWEYQDKCKEDCVDCEDCVAIMDKEFPLDLNNTETLIKILQNELLSPFVQMKEDRTGNSADSVKQESK